jgi:uncharacterized protein YuzE
MKRAVE